MVTVEVKRGDTFRRVFAYLDSEGDAVNLTDCTARFAAKAKEDAEGPKVIWAPAVLTEPAGEIAINGPLGLVTIAVSAELMAAVDPGVYLADIEVTWPSGDVMSTETFAIKVLPDITT
jgi:hypothetical protein